MLSFTLIGHMRSSNEKKWKVCEKYERSQKNGKVYCTHALYIDMASHDIMMVQTARAKGKAKKIIRWNIHLCIYVSSTLASTGCVYAVQ